MTSPSNPLIYLASASPRRSALLQQVGVAHRIEAVDADESIKPHEQPREYVSRLAILKAQTLWSRLPLTQRTPVLGADTCVVLEEEILGKPRDHAHYLQMLHRLSGRTHHVYTAVALRHASGTDCLVNISAVTFRKLEDAEIEDYWLSGEPADKAGGYAIQGIAALFIDHMAGSYSGIMGLPLAETGMLLRSIGWRFIGVRCGARSTINGPLTEAGL